MPCPLCGTRRAKRRCPALAKDICPVCCGTKRRVEIACPDACTWLGTAETHPPAVVRRQRQRDFDFAVPMLHRLPEPAYRLVLLFQDALARHRVGAVPPLLDRDVAEACAALASTLETSARGIIYEHQPGSLPAQRLRQELRATLERAVPNPTGAVERDAATALRRIEAAARTAGTKLEGGDRAYLEFVERLPRQLASGAAEEAPPAPGLAGDERPRIVLP
jgi:hypothetical protein